MAHVAMKKSLMTNPKPKKIPMEEEYDSINIEKPQPIRSKIPLVDVVDITDRAMNT